MTVPTYADYCKLKCPEGCGKGLEKCGPEGGNQYHLISGKYILCTAPTLAAYAELLRERLEGARTALLELRRCSCSLSDFMYEPVRFCAGEMIQYADEQIAEIDALGGAQG